MQPALPRSSHTLTCNAATTAPTTTKTGILTAVIYKTLPSPSRRFSKSCWEGRAACWCNEDGIRTPSSSWEYGFVTETEQEVRPPDFHSLPLEWNLVLVIQAGD